MSRARETIRTCHDALAMPGNDHRSPLAAHALPDNDDRDGKFFSHSVCICYTFVTKRRMRW